MFFNLLKKIIVIGEFSFFKMETNNLNYYNDEIINVIVSWELNYKNKNDFFFIQERKM